MIYLDYQATTPLAPEVVASMTPWIADNFANPHSPSTDGRRAAAAIEIARMHIDAHFVAEGDVCFTSGATEAINWAMLGSFERASRRKLVTIATEHAAVLDTADHLGQHGIEIIRLGVGEDGLVDLDEARAAIDDQTALVAAMLVNNEIGVIQPVAELAAMAHDVGALFLCDAVQGFGRARLPSVRGLHLDFGSQDSWPERRRRLVDPKRRRDRSAAPWRRAGKGCSVGNPVADAVRGVWRSRSADDQPCA